jgi:hypothetical protein
MHDVIASPRWHCRRWSPATGRWWSRPCTRWVMCSDGRPCPPARRGHCPDQAREPHDLGKVRPVLARMSLLTSQLAAGAATAIEHQDPLSGCRLAVADDEVPPWSAAITNVSVTTRSPLRGEFATGSPGSYPRSILRWEPVDSDERLAWRQEQSR